MTAPCRVLPVMGGTGACRVCGQPATSYCQVCQVSYCPCQASAHVHSAAEEETALSGCAVILGLPVGERAS